MRKVKRDLLRSPAKAAALAALLLVAIWFWAPLLKRWLTEDSGSTSESVAVTQTAPAEIRAVPAKQPGPPATDVNDTETRGWSELLALIEQDQRTKSAQSAGPAVHPFGARQVPVESSETANQPVTVPDDLHPKELGLVLMSTVVGPRSRLASIDGKVYRPGETIEVAYTGGPESATIVQYRLEEIQSTFVTLSGGAKVYRLPLQRRQLADDSRKRRVVEERRDG